MRGKMKLFKYGQKGFTLVEVLVVIAILGALAGVVIISVIQFIGRGACEAAATEKHNIQIAAVAYSYVIAPAKFAVSLSIRKINVNLRLIS